MVRFQTKVTSARLPKRFPSNLNYMITTCSKNGQVQGGAEGPGEAPGVEGILSVNVEPGSQSSISFHRGAPYLKRQYMPPGQRAGLSLLSSAACRCTLVGGDFFRIQGY